MKTKDKIYLTIEKWNQIAETPHDYLKIRSAIESGHEVALTNECGNVYAYLKIDEINNIKYVYKGFVN